MDDKFGRIVSEPLLMDGQAHIRNTSVTVDEIMRLSLDGQSQADILKKYSQINAEDIHQAMAYNAHLSTIKMANLSQTIRTHLAHIEGFTDLSKFIHQQNNDDLLSKLPRMLSNIKLSVHRLTSILDSNLSELSEQTNNPSHPQLNQIKMHDVEKHIIQFLNNENVQISIDMAIRDRKVNRIVLDTIDCMVMDMEMMATITAVLIYGRKENFVFEIWTESIPDVHDKLAENTQWDTPLSIARELIKRIGSQLDVIQKQDNTIFAFELPIREDEQD